MGCPGRLVRRASKGLRADATRYPDAAVRWLVGERRSRVLDLGAGTGKLTRSLVGPGHAVVAVEASPEMIAELRRAVPGAEAIEGRAERIPVPAGRFDLVTSAQAFHWFDPGRTLPEIVRVLRPGGRLGLIWNLWAEESPLVARLSALLPGDAEESDPVRVVRESTLFGPVEEASFDWIRSYGREELVERVGTSSSVATLVPAERDAALAAVGRLWDEEAAAGALELPYRTFAYRADRR